MSITPSVIGERTASRLLRAKTMKAEITAKVKNSPKFPVKVFTAVEIMEFPDDSNVFGRMLAFRQHFRKKFGQEIELDIVSCKWLEEKEKVK